MEDYRKCIEQFKDIKEIAELMDEIDKLRDYYSSQRYNDMQHHITTIMMKHPKETVTWNAIFKTMPTTIKQSYINAEMFLRAQCTRVLSENDSHVLGLDITEGERIYLHKLAER